MLVLWLLGGGIAFCGSLCYAEFATMQPDVGGEYVYLKKTYGMMPAFLSGWISLFVAFSASIAISAIFFHKYLANFVIALVGPEDFKTSILANDWVLSSISASIVILLGITHIIGIHFGSRIQNVLTTIKVTVLLSFIFLGLVVADWSHVERLTNDYSNGNGLGPAGLGSTLMLIMSAYSGWNSATYVAGEIKNPSKNLPRALFWGTFSVTMLYLAINVVFLLSSPADQIMGKWTIGAIAADNLFGPVSAKLFNTGIMLILLSSISVQMMIGPRVYYAMSRDRVIFKALSKVSDRFRTPHIAIIVQIIITVIYIYLGINVVDLFYEYISFALSLTPFLTVVGLIYLRYKYPDLERPYKVKFFPLVAFLYLGANLFMMGSSLVMKLRSSLFAIGILVLGIVVYYIWRFFADRLSADKEVEVSGNTDPI